MPLTPIEKEEFDKKFSDIGEEVGGLRENIKEISEKFSAKVQEILDLIKKKIEEVKREITPIGIQVLAVPTYLKISSITFIIDGGGSVITTGEKGHLRIPFACEIERVTLLADQSGSIVIDIWKDTYANFPPTDADSITAAAPPTISSAQKSEDTTLTGWAKTINAGDILAFNVDSCATITRVTLALKVKKT